MKLKLNGTDSEMKDGITVAGLLNTLNIEPVRVAVEVNLNIIKKCDYEKHVLNDGDAVEIVNFVGGG
jgi:sulfur carrier protein